MMQIIPKYKITFGFLNRDNTILYMHNNFINNIMRAVSGIDFGFDTPVTRIKIELVEMKQEGHKSNPENWPSNDRSGNN